MSATVTVAAGESAAVVNDDVVRHCLKMKLASDSNSDSVDCDCGLTADGNWESSELAGWAMPMNL